MGDTIRFLYHPVDAAAEVGQQFAVLELPNKTEGLVTQVIGNESLEYAGLQQENIQRILEQRITTIEIPVNRERGMGEIKSLKVAIAKIRKRIKSGKWCTWDGWIPTRNVEVHPIEADELLRNVMPNPRHLLRAFVKSRNTAVGFDGPRLNMVNVITGVKGSGKSHLAKHLVLALSERSVPCIIFDINGEYIALPNAQVLRWGENFVPDLAEVGHEMLSLVVREIYPLPTTSESVLDGMLPVVFGRRRAQCSREKKEFTIDLVYLRSQTWSNNEHVQGAIDDRLRVIANMGLFASLSTEVSEKKTSTVSDFAELYQNACDGRPIVFDIRDLNQNLQHALVTALNKTIESICNEETKSKLGRYPFVFYEEAHFYIREGILNIITRGRHIGIASVFVTNTPQNLPDTVFRQLDNLFLLALTHRDDIRNVSKNSFTDEETIQSFATRMPERHALIVGAVTDRYPLILSVDPLPKDVRPTGQTRSTWERFEQTRGPSAN